MHPGYGHLDYLATWPLYQATNLLVELYTDDRLPARLRPLKRGA